MRVDNPVSERIERFPLSNRSGKKRSALSLSIVDAFFWFNVLILPIFDNMSGALFKLKIIGDGSIGSPSQLGRLLATVFVIYLISKLSTKNTQKTAFFVLFYFTLVECVSALFHWEFKPFLYGVVTSSKIVYVVFCILFFVDQVKQKRLTRFELERWLIIYGTVVSVLVLLAYFSGFHIANYSKGIATRGLFVSGNGLGVVMGSCALVLVHQTQKFSFKRLAHILMLLVTTALIGTKGGLIFFLCGLSYLAMKLAKKFPFISLALFSIIAYYVVPPLLEILGSVFENIIYKFNNIDNKWVLLASSRDQFIINAFEQVTWFGFYSIRVLFGAGAFFGYLDPTAFDVTGRKLLENDLFELFFCYGLISAVSYIFMFFYGIYRAFVYGRFFYIALFGLIFLHSITAGHVVFNGTSSIMLAFAIGCICCTSKLPHTLNNYK